MNTFLNYKLFIEPYNMELNNSITSIFPLKKYDNLLVKNLFLDGYEYEYPLDSFNNVYEYFNWCYSFFDKIIILDRRNKISQSESFAVNETLIRTKGIGWHTPKIYDIDKIEPSYISTMVERYTNSSEVLKSISLINKLPLFYYEDIFEKHDLLILDNLFKYLELELDKNYYNEFILSPNRKVRIDKSHKKII
jgi:hypothetical protein